MKKGLAVLVLSAVPLAVAAQSEAQLVERYTPLAGSKENATALVTGLRNGKEVKLSDGTVFTPRTGKTGNGNVDNTLALAQAQLRKDGITNPTPTQLRTAVAGINDQRADGKGWGQIAKSMDMKMGDVKRASTNGRAASANGRPAQSARVERPERPERPHGRSK